MDMKQAPTNSDTVRILILQGNQEDAELCLRKLRTLSGIKIHADMVSTPLEFADHFDTQPYDLVLSGSCPQWSALSTLHFIESRGRRVPLIVLADGVGDQLASESIAAGAADYVLKQDLDRLQLVLWRVLAEQKLRQDRDRAERELRESEQQYRLLFLANPNPMWVCDIGTLRFLAVNDAAVTHYGYSREEFLSMTIGDVHPEEIPFIERQHSSFCATGVASREVWKHVKKDGVTIDVEMSSQAILFQGHKVLLVLAHDITAIRNAEAALRESREQLRLLLDSSAEAIFGLDMDGACTFCNAAAIRMLGYHSAAELLGHNMHAKIHGRRADGRSYLEAECCICRGLRAGTPAHSGDDVFWRSDGNSFPVEYWSHPVVRDEVVVGSVVTFFDITEKRKAEEALRRTEEQYHSIIKGAPYGIYRADSNSNLLMVNPALVTMLGYDFEAELLRLGASGAIYCHPQDRVCQQEKYSSGHDRVAGVEAALRRKDGGHVTVRLSARRIHSGHEGTPGYEVFVEDITQQRHLERQLLQAQKMEAVGQLAGGVAHDFNNLLMVINGFAQLIADSANDPVKIAHYAGQITEAGTKAASVTKQLLAFSRSQVQDLKVLDLNRLVSDLCVMLPRFMGEDVEMFFSPFREPSLVRADQAQIEQVLMNLVLNARDAMPNGGRVSIAADRVHLDEAYFSSRDVQMATPGYYIMLSVTDTGCGMDETTRARVFEPFFTTKERDKGTGLGLATVYGIVKQSGGFVWVYSELGQGTTFKVYLPAAEGTVPVVDKPMATDNDLVGSETILVVEDERGIRDVTCSYLAAKGYQVLQASNPVEALRIFSEAKQPIHLMLTDMIMPGGNGPELVSAVRDMGLEFPVIFMSGYADRSKDPETLGSNGIFLQKPFSLATLARAVRNALEESRAVSSG